MECSVEKCTSLERLEHVWGLSKSIIHYYLNRIGINQYDNLVSPIMTERYLLNKVSVYISFHGRHKLLPFLNRIVTEDKKRLSYKNMSIKRYW